jgi:aspartate racemase
LWIEYFKMKTMGLIGGMSWESTVTYYRLINQGIKARLGGHHSAKMILHSVDFAEIEQLQKTDQWDEAGKLLGSAARSLEIAGAECIVLCTNTMHKVATQIEQAVSIPLLHIADGTAAAIKAAGVDTVGLLGTRFTMEQDFYVGRLRDRHGIKVLTPTQEERDEVHRVIYEELVHGTVLEDSRKKYLQIVERLARQDAQGIVLGCTEISMLIKSSDVSLHYFDTAELHASSAVDFALS